MVRLGGIPVEKKVIYAIILSAIVVTASAAVLYVLATKENEPGQKYPVYFVTMPVTGMKGSLASGGIDGFIAWEPFGSEAIIEGVGTALEWSSEIMPNHPCCVVVASTDYLSKDLGSGLKGSDITLRFVKAHVETTKWMLDALAHKSGANYTLLVNLGMQFTSKSQAIVVAALDHLKYGYQMDEAFMTGITNFTEMFINSGVITSDKLALGGYSNVTDFVQKYANQTFLSAQSTVQPSGSILNPSDPVRIGFLKADIHQLAQWVAQNKTVGGGSKSLFEKYGVYVTNASTTGGYNSGPEEMDKFAAGEVDIGYLGCAPAIQKHLNAQVHTVMVAQANSEGSAIIVKANAGIRSMDDLQNKTIAVPSTGSIQYVLLRAAVEDAGLQLQLKT
jgi:NitT/TauT family transport system substrate-binding protein